MPDNRETRVPWNPFVGISKFRGSQLDFLTTKISYLLEIHRAAGKPSARAAAASGILNRHAFS